MIKEEIEHAGKTKAFASLSSGGKATELVFQLRNQNGFQDSQPGRCHIFQDRNGKDPDSAAARLVRMGAAAVPALIRALDSEMYSGSIGYWRNFRFSHHMLTVGDCSLDILQRIAQRDFTPADWLAGREEKRAAIRQEVEKWWKSAKAARR